MCCNWPAPHLFLLSILYAAAPIASAQDWPGFRGPTGQGQSDEPTVPTEWGTDKNIAWKTEIPGAGWSSPIYWQNRVYLTAAVPVEGRRPNDQNLLAVCLDAADGDVVWSKAIFEQRHDQTTGVHDKNSHASPTPVTDGRHLFVHFGTQGTACVTLDGEIEWATRELAYKPVHGGGSSPVLVDGAVVVSCDGSDMQFVVALDQKTGQVRWRKDRPPVDRKGFSFCTPLVIDVEGQRQIVSPATDQVVAYRPRDGQELWRFPFDGYSVVPRPVFGHGLLFISTSFDQPTLYALRPDSKFEQPKVAWSTDKGAPHTPSPLLVGDELYFVSDRGVGTCVDARTGEFRWVKRLGGNYSASPVHAGGHVYFQNEEGGTVVIEPGRAYREVTRNSLPGRTLASYAVADASIFLRTDTHLYRIREQ